MTWTLNKTISEAEKYYLGRMMKPVWWEYLNELHRVVFFLLIILLIVLNPSPVAAFLVTGRYLLLIWEVTGAVSLSECPQAWVALLVPGLSPVHPGHG